MNRVETLSLLAGIALLAAAAYSQRVNRHAKRTPFSG